MIIKGDLYSVDSSDDSACVRKNGDVISQADLTKTGFKVKNFTNNRIPREIMWRYARALREMSHPAPSDDKELPYSFDLCYDIKHMSQLKEIIQRADELRDMALEHGINI